MITRKYTAAIIATIALCAVSAFIAMHTAFSRMNVAPPINIKAQVTPGSTVLIISSAGGSTLSKELSILQLYFGHTHVQTVNAGRVGTRVLRSLPSALVIVTGNGLIPNDTRMRLLAKAMLMRGRPVVFVATSSKPLNTAALLKFLREVGVGGITFSNIRSSLNPKSSDNGDLIYVFGLKILRGGGPMMYVLSSEKGVKTTAAEICNYTVKAVAGMLKLDIRIING